MHWPVKPLWDKRLFVIYLHDPKKYHDEVSRQRWHGDRHTVLRSITHWPFGKFLYWKWSDYPIPLGHWKEMCKRAGDF